MSDESQPNDVLEPQLEPELMDPEPVNPEKDPTDAASETLMETPVEPAGDEPPVESETLVETPAEVAVSAETTQGGAAPPEADVVVTEMEDVPVEAREMSAEASGAPVDRAPNVVRIGDIEDSEPSVADKVVQSINRFAASMQGRGWVAVVVAAVLFVAFLFLPPISLGQRLADMGGYTTLNAETPSVEHPDGLTVERTGTGEGRIRIKLDSIPRVDFVAGSLPDALSEALASIPERLEPKSPYYSLDVKADNGSGGMLTVVIPNESEPWETLDLYSWDGEAWTWLPTHLDRDREVLESTVEALPVSVMVMQTPPASLRTVAESPTWPVEGAQAAALTEVDISGILIGTMGGTTGDATLLPMAVEGGETMLAPTVRNWLVGREPNWALVSEMVSVESSRNAHVQNLVGLAQSGGYTGLVLDYQAVQSSDRQAYAEFVQDLAAAMHDVGLWLAVVVDTPVPGPDGWQTGGYDWRAIGRAVDQLRVVMPLNPEAYTPGGQAEQLIEWATTLVNRQKLVPVYSTMSTDAEQVVALETVLASVGNIQAQDTLTDFVQPGTSLGFILGPAVDLEMNAETGATRLTTADNSYWLGTPQWLKTKMDLAARYRLNGVVLRHIFDEGNLAGIQEAVASYEGGSAVGSYAPPDVTWEVTGPTLEKTEHSTPLAQPQFVWTAPEVTGTYRIAASVGSLDKGFVPVEVSVPAPVITETEVVTDTTAEEDEADGTATEPEEESDDEAPTLQAGFVADVSVPDNTQFENGADFTKTWRLRNTGTEPWPEDTTLAYLDGAVLSESEEVEVGEVGVGEDVDISVDMIAPDEDGTYRSNWQLQAGDTTFDGGVVYVQIVVGEPEAEAPAPEPEPAAPAPAPAPVASGSFELGGHVRDMGLPYKDKMRYAGMTWIKTQIPYGTDARGLINVAHSNGFKIQLSAIGGAGMVVNPGFEQDFSNWLAGVAAAGADAIEVWNEPNIDREWQNGHISPQAYTNLLCTAYNAIKNANPGTAVISAAPAPTGFYGGCGPGGCDDQPWMEGLYNAGAANCMDYIGAHHNAGATSPSARIGHPANPGDPHHSWFFLPQTELYYNVFRGSRQVFYTEMGYASQEGVPTFSDGFGWARGTDNSEQAAWLAEAVQLGINTGMVRCIIVWNIDFVRYGDDPQDGFAIVRPGGGCPACESLHNVLGSR